MLYGKRVIQMNEIVATARCYRRACGGVMEGRIGNYPYRECGLDSVTLKGIRVYHCTECNALVPEIPAAGVLHRLIAVHLLNKKTLLSGAEVRFLRKLCGYSAEEFSTIMGSSKAVISRWENQNTHGGGTDRTIRLLVLDFLVREIAGKSAPVLKDVTVEQLSRQVLDTIKELADRRSDEQYEIPYKDIERSTQNSNINSREPVLV